MELRRLVSYTLLAGMTLLSFVIAWSQETSAPRPAGVETKKTYPASLVEQGAALFRQDCSFCHGRDATGGESGPDLTSSKLVAADVSGEKIAAVVRNGQPDRGMPAFNRTDQQIASLVAFMHTRREEALAHDRRRGVGGRKGVDPADLQTGNASAGKKYFDGAGGCAACHSPTEDLAGIASRYQGLELEERMLYPRHAKSKVTVTLPSGQEISGTLAYLDEFTVGLKTPNGVYQSWRTRDVNYKVNTAVEAHADLFSKYSDDDVHNLMAYLQTLK